MVNITWNLIAMFNISSSGAQQIKMNSINDNPIIKVCVSGLAKSFFSTFLHEISI